MYAKLLPFFRMTGLAFSLGAAASVYEKQYVSLILLFGNEKLQLTN